MKGKYSIKLKNKKMQYSLEISRQVSIIRGDSSTGKSSFVAMLKQHISEVNKGTFPTTILETNISLKNIHIMSGDDEHILSKIEEYSKSIIILDEDCDYFFNKKSFGSYVKNSDNYFVIVSRRKLAHVPYSIDSVFCFENSVKAMNGIVYTSSIIKKVFSNDYIKVNDCSVIITEDVGLGCEVYRKVCPNAKVVSAKGNSAIQKMIGEELGINSNASISVICDNSAYGNYIGDLIKFLEFKEYLVSLYAPESFEWLILKSLYSKKPEVLKVLESPWDFCETTKYYSYERMYTSLLNSIYLKYFGVKYTKGNTSDKMLAEVVAKKDYILNILNTEC